MEGYKILCLVGEGSFGRVFKAKRRTSKDIVALKIIRKCGRSQKEIMSLRSECEIQKHLLHRNIIQMIDSFETGNEIVVVTEFCKRDLHFILSKQSYLSEDAALPIVCDLVSALYYLHSNRVLHRDLKPQNVMITEEGVAKLCDFGFARSMSRGTHVLTSIKGTPLYMAPELIEESPYDHKADLWSLGCIVYEMVVGAPPFSTNSILQLVRMIRFEEVVWPACLSQQCRHLLQGLLVKDPAHRLSWPLLVNHPFLQERVSSSIASGISLPLTKELTSSQTLAKESQKRNLAIKAQVAQTQGLPQKIQHILDQETKLLTKGGLQSEGIAATAIDLDNLEQKMSKWQIADIENKLHPVGSEPSPNTPSEDTTSEEESGEARGGSPLEAEEWLAFLEQSMREVMRGDMDSICDKGVVTMVTSSLSNHGATPKVSEYVACLLSLPHVAPGVSAKELAVIARVYAEVKVVSSLMFALKLLTNRSNCSSSQDGATEAGKLSSEQLTALERILVLINQLVHSDREFLSQFCDVVTLLHLCPRLHLLLSVHSVQPRIATDLVAILTHILRQMPENANIVDECLQPAYSTGFDLLDLLKHANKTLQVRVCLLLQFMSQHCVKKLESLWSQTLRDYVELLAYDSSQDIRCAAEDLLEVVKELPFYYIQLENIAS